MKTSSKNQWKIENFKISEKKKQNFEISNFHWFFEDFFSIFLISKNIFLRFEILKIKFRHVKLIFFAQLFFVSNVWLCSIHKWHLPHPRELWDRYIRPEPSWVPRTEISVPEPRSRFWAHISVLTTFPQSCSKSCGVNFPRSNKLWRVRWCSLYFPGPPEAPGTAPATNRSYRLPAL